jgi:hypothetical protein
MNRYNRETSINPLNDCDRIGVPLDLEVYHEVKKEMPRSSMSLGFLLVWPKKSLLLHARGNSGTGIRIGPVRIVHSDL